MSNVPIIVLVVDPITEVVALRIRYASRVHAKSGANDLRQTYSGHALVWATETERRQRLTFTAIE